MTDVADTAEYFETFYQGEQPVAGMRFRAVPWDIGAAQPFVIEAERAGRIRGAVVDAGCGLGDNAIHLARQGYPVTGIDCSATAVSWARKRALAAGVQVEFVVGDAIAMDGFHDRFDTVVDSGLIECLVGDQRAAYVSALYRATRPGALLNMFSVDVEALPAPIPGVYHIPEDEMRAMLSDAGWTVTAARETTYLCNEDAAAFFTNTGAGADTDVDEAGRVRLAALAIEAERT